LREEHRLSALEDSVLKEIFGAHTNELRGKLRILHNEELNDL
jgi:hypothetical protein